MKVKFCPECGETDLVMVAGGGIGMWKCKKCKFQGSIFPEKEIKLEVNKLKKNKKIKNKTKKK